GAAAMEFAREGSISGLAYAVVDSNAIIDSSGYGLAGPETMLRRPPTLFCRSALFTR
ncbi:MAG: CubicO group peptidase (beta-lactamase class C family), partial [Acidimicrobiales bacterium]